MRYSSNPEDPGFQNWANADGTITVYLDGIELPACMTCDTDEGWAIVCRRDKDGRLFAVNDEIATMKVVGKIEVR